MRSICMNSDCDVPPAIKSSSYSHVQIYLKKIRIIIFQPSPTQILFEIPKLTTSVTGLRAERKCNVRKMIFQQTTSLHELEHIFLIQKILSIDGR